MPGGEDRPSPDVRCSGPSRSQAQAGRESWKDTEVRLDDSLGVRQTLAPRQGLRTVSQSHGRLGRERELEHVESEVRVGYREELSD